MAAGTYYENLSVADKNLNIIATEGADKTKVFASSSASVVSFSGTGANGSSLTGFTLSGGAGYRGGYNQYGGGIDISLPAGSAIDIKNCVISDNNSSSITFGGGMHISGGGTANVTNTLFRNNAAWANGGAILVEGANLVLDACTVVDNKSNYFNEIGGISAAGNCDIQIKNSILWGNAGSQYGSFTSGPSGTGKFTFENSAVQDGVNVSSSWGNTLTQSASLGTNYTQDPVFSGASDYSLAPDSPYTDAGSVSAEQDPDGSVAALGYRSVFQTAVTSDPLETVTSSVTYPLQDGEVHLILTGNADIDGTGNALDNSLTGNSGSNVLDGRAGNDTITGGGGNDTLVGGDGNDLLLVQPTVSNQDSFGDSLVAHYCLDGNTLDSSGTGKDAVNYGATATQDRFNNASKALYFNGSSFVQTPVDSNLSSLTITAWFKSSTTNGERSIVDSDVSGQFGHSLILGYCDGDSTLDIQYHNGWLDSGWSPTPDTWYQTAAVYEPGKISLYVDGILTASQEVTEWNLDGGDFRIGRHNSGDPQWFNGSVDDVRIYNRSLNAEDIKALYEFESQPSSTSTSSSGNNSLSGGDGDDTLEGGVGNDTLSGGDGSDLITAGSGKGGSTYQLIQGYYTWDQAKADAVARGGHLATITSEQEWKNITGQLGAGFAVGHEAWIGATDEEKEGVWKWITGETFDFSKWRVGEPSGHSDSNEDYASIFGDSRQGAVAGESWNDDFPYDSLSYLLETESPTSGNNSLSGGDGNDTLAGSLNADTLDGGTGNDSMLGGAGDDLYLVDSTSDVLSENSAEGTDTVSASITYTLGANLENLILTGAAAINATGNTLANSLTGNAAANQLDGGAGNDTMAGGAGNDTYIVDSASDTIQEEAAAGTDTVRSSVSYTLGANLENLVLTGSAASKATGNSLANAITGNAAANAISAGAGNDTLAGGAGNDTLNAGTGIDIVKGEAGSDLLQIDWSSLPSYTVTKTVRKDGTGASASFSGSYTAKNTAGAVLSSVTFDGIEALSLNGQSINLENAVASPGVTFSRTSQATATTEQGGLVQFAVVLNKAPVENVTLKFTSTDLTEGKVNTPSLTFTSKNWNTPQALIIQGVDDYLNDGNIAYSVISQIVTTDLTYNRIVVPTINLLNNDDGFDNDRTIYGTDDTDYLTGMNGNDRIYGKGGQDDIKGGIGNDRLYGQEDDDRLFGEAGNDQLYGGYDDDTLDGGAGDDSLFGEQGNDTLLGSDGNDYIDGGIEADSMVGGAGNDTYVVDSANDKINDLGASTDVDTVTVIQTITYTLPTNIENASINAAGNGGLVGNTLNNDLTGNDGKNVLDGGVGNDSLDGGSGADSLLGGAGNDVLEGGSGNDTLRGGAGVDLADFQNSGVNVNVNLVTGLANGSDGNDMLFEIENILGGVGSDTLIGNTTNNDLEGGLGNDSLDGGAGRDTLSGGIGNDTLRGGAGVDSVDFEAAMASLNVNLATGSVTGEGTDVLFDIENVIAGIGNDSLNGSSANNSIIGGAGRDSLNGGDGADTLTGSAYGANGGRGEIDTLAGGTGADVFNLGYANGAFYDDGNTATTGTADYVVISDFTAGSDQLQLDGAASGYYLAASGVSGVTGTGLWAEQGKTDELIAIIRSANSTTLTAANTLNTAVFV